MTWRDYDGVPWHTLNTDLGDIEVRPHTLEIAHVRGRGLVIGRVDTSALRAGLSIGSRTHGQHGGAAPQRNRNPTSGSSGRMTHRNASAKAYRTLATELERRLAECSPR